MADGLRGRRLNRGRLWKKRDQRQTLTWSPRFRLAYIGEQPFPPESVPLRRSRREFKTNESLESFGKWPGMSRRRGCEDGAWEERGRRGRMERRDWRRELAGGQKCDLNGEVWSKTFYEKWNKGLHCLNLLHVFFILTVFVFCQCLFPFSWTFSDQACKHAFTDTQLFRQMFTGQCIASVKWT